MWVCGNEIWDVGFWIHGMRCGTRLKRYEMGCTGTINPMQGVVYKICDTRYEVGAMSHAMRHTRHEIRWLGQEMRDRGYEIRDTRHHT